MAETATLRETVKHQVQALSDTMALLDATHALADKVCTCEAVNVVTLLREAFGRFDRILAALEEGVQEGA